MGICLPGLVGYASEPVGARGASERTDGIRVLLELGDRDRVAVEEVREKRREAAVPLLRMRAERAGLDGATG